MVHTLKTIQDCIHTVRHGFVGYPARHVPSPPGHSMTLLEFAASDTPMSRSISPIRSSQVIECAPTDDGSVCACCKVTCTKDCHVHNTLHLPVYVVNSMLSRAGRGAELFHEQLLVAISSVHATITSISQSEGCYIATITYNSCRIMICMRLRTVRTREATCNHDTNIVWKLRITLATLKPRMYNVIQDIPLCLLMT